MLNVYLIKRTATTSYDEACGFVVVAKTAAKAREAIVKSKLTGDEGKVVWTNRADSRIEKIGITDKYKAHTIILRDYVNG